MGFAYEVFCKVSGVRLRGASEMVKMVITTFRLAVLGLGV